MTRAGTVATGGDTTLCDVVNAGFKSAERIMAKVDLSALQDAADAARGRADDDFAALVAEKLESGRLAKGAKFLVAKFALQSDPRFKAAKKRAEELYKSIIQREKAAAEGGAAGAGVGAGAGGGGVGGAAGAGTRLGGDGAGFMPPPAGLRRAAPPPPMPLPGGGEGGAGAGAYDARQYQHLQPCGYVVNGGVGQPPQMMQQQHAYNPAVSGASYFAGQPPQMMQQQHAYNPVVGGAPHHMAVPPQMIQQQQQQRVAPQHQQHSSPHSYAYPVPPPGSGGYGNYATGPLAPAPPRAQVPPPAAPSAPPGRTPPPPPSREREGRAASPKRTRVEGDGVGDRMDGVADYRERDRD